MSNTNKKKLASSSVSMAMAKSVNNDITEDIKMSKTNKAGTASATVVGYACDVEGRKLCFLSNGTWSYVEENLAVSSPATDSEVVSAKEVVETSTPVSEEEAPATEATPTAVAKEEPQVGCYLKKGSKSFWVSDTEGLDLKERYAACHEDVTKYKMWRTKEANENGQTRLICSFMDGVLVDAMRDGTGMSNVIGHGKLVKGKFVPDDDASRIGFDTVMKAAPHTPDAYFAYKAKRDGVTEAPASPEPVVKAEAPIVKEEPKVSEEKAEATPKMPKKLEVIQKALSAAIKTHNLYGFMQKHLCIFKAVKDENKVTSGYIVNGCYLFDAEGKYVKYLPSIKENTNKG